MVMDMLERVLPPVDAAQEAAGAVARAKVLLKYHRAEMGTMRHPMAAGAAGGRMDAYVGLDMIHKYLHGKQPHPSIPAGASNEVTRLALMSRVNILDLVVSSLAQALYVDGYRGARESEDAPAWQVWQENKLDARQAGVYRAALAYGLSYVTVLPGDPVPVIRRYSPRRMVAIYGDDEDWPVLAMAVEPSGTNWALTLFDERSRYRLAAKALDDGESIEFLQSDRHDAGVTPVVRFLNVDDLDEDNEGEIERLIPIQDQIDETTFGLLVAQKYAAFRQRYIIGWTSEDENAKLKAAASKLWTFEDEDVKVGEFEQTDLKGYLDSREASIRHAAALSQTPAHELLGQLVNLSAEALVAAETSQRRKATERQMSFGESWEQMFGLAAHLGGFEVATAAEVRWRDTESRALSATVDALGKMAKMLNIPPQELWERIPGVTQQDVGRWKEAFREGDAIANLAKLLERQGARNDGDESGE